jgi:membrane protein EpsK
MALGIGLVCGFSEPLLRLWLGPSFGDLAPLLFIMAIHLCVNLSMYPLYGVPLATNRMRTQGLVALGVGIGNLLLALFLAQVCGWGLYGLAVAGAIMLTIRYFLFTPLYAARILDRPYGTFFRAVPSIVLATLATIGLCKVILWYSAISNWLQLGMAVAAVSLLFSSLVYLLLSSQERMAFKNTVARFRKAA